MRTLSRFSLVFVAVIFVAATIFAILVTWIWDWKFFLPATVDKATRINTIVAVSAYTAAALGAIIALMAYWQASGRPSLKPEITFPSLKANELVFKIDASERTDVRMLKTRDMNLFGTVRIRNSTQYAAQNPGLRISFEGLYFNAISVGWTVADSWGDMRGAKAVQWDGGTESIIHGKWSRTLPDLDFNAVIICRLSPPPELIMTIVSDGCRPKVRRIPIKLS
jgi:hypothetical protein